MCVGEDIRTDDYPPGLFSAEELDVLCQETSGISYDSEYDNNVAETSVPFTLYHFTSLGVSGMEEDVCLVSKSLALIGHFSTLDISKDPAYNCIRMEILVDEETYFPEDQQ